MSKLNATTALQLAANTCKALAYKARRDIANEDEAFHKFIALREAEREIRALIKPRKKP